MIDILEQGIADYDSGLFKTLLLDRTTRKNIKWCTDNYKEYGENYFPTEEIQPSLITGIHGKIIQPRVSKSVEEQMRRTKEKAEVFTPSWICNEQNNLVDAAWFGREDVFNHSENGEWYSTEGRITFPADKTWHDYVKAVRMEVSCGEAPYLVSRYDTVTGKTILVSNRIGLLDRKLRIVHENTNNEQDWLKWAKKAFMSCYGYDFQGDNVLLARENLLYTFVDYMQEYYDHEPKLKDMLEIARIISWNIWQMDGITMTVPYSEQENVYVQMPLFNEEGTGASETGLPQIPCRIYDWGANRSILFTSLMKQ